MSAAGEIALEPAPSHAACPSCGFPLDAAAPGAVPCPTCGEHVHGTFCRHCGTEVASGRAFGVEHPEGPAWRRAVKVASGPLAEYFDHARSIVFPSRLVHEIRSGQLTGVEVFGFWVAAAALTALIAAFLPNPMRRLEIPVVAEVFEAMWTMALTALVYAPIHLVFRRGHRRTSFREYLVTTLTIGALLYPFLALSHGLLTLAGITTPGYVTAPLTLAFYVGVYAELYGRAWWRTALWLVACLLGMLLTVFAVLAAIAFVAQKAGYLPAKAPAAVAAKRG
jgi:hypothetical protein